MTPLSADPTARATFDRAIDLAERLAAVGAKPSIDLEGAPPSPSPAECGAILRFAEATVADAKGAAMDRFLDGTRATYTWRAPSGAPQSAAVFPQFRIARGYNEATALGLPGALPKRTPALDQAINSMTLGRATPAQVAQVTQALIDAGNLVIPPGGDPLTAIRAMQWKYGVGLDCARYVQQAFLACRGLDPLSPATRARFGFAADLGNEDLCGVAKSPKFRAIDPAAAKPGDLMLLGPPKDQLVGHTLLVRSNLALAPSWRADLLARNPEPSVRALLTADVRVVEVDSSWGGGKDGHGGVAREAWLYEPTTKRWATWAADGEVTLSAPGGPYDHPLIGVFRPKGEP